MNTSRIAVFSLLASICLCVGAWFTDGYWQNFTFMFAEVSFSLGIGLFIVNIYIGADERRAAAIPLLRLLSPDVEMFHNEFFIRKGRLAFGTPAFNALIDAYEKHGRRPDALSPEQRDGLYCLIESNKDGFLPVLSRLHETLKEMSSILGWSFSPSLMRNILDCRYSLVALQTIKYDHSTEDKLSACAKFLEVETDLTAVLTDLTSMLGMKQEDIIDKTN